MRVLHVFSGNMYGGIETFLVALARGAAAAPELEQHFALCFAGRLSEELTAAGARIHYLGEVRTRNYLSVRRARRRLTEIAQEQQIEAVICHAAWSQALFGRAAREAVGSQLYWQHDSHAGKHWLERWARRNVPDLVLSNSRFSAGTLPHLFPQARFEIIRYPVAPSEIFLSEGEIRALRAENETPGGATVIIQVSRLEEWKGHRLHLQALARLREKPDWVVWFAGGAQRPHEARYLSELQQLAATLGVAERVRWLGQRPDVPRLLQAADIFCQPNTGPEPFGIVFVEALYAGLPVVATALGGALEIVDETCGILTPPDDADALATAVQSLLDAPERRQQYAAPAQTRARELCEPQAQLKRLTAILNGLNAPNR